MNLNNIQRSFGYAVVIGGNLIPFYGIYAWGWDIFSVFFLYWAENAIVGIYTLLMMLVVAAHRGILAVLFSFFTMAFFCLHYGMFCLAHLAILTELFGKEHLLHQNFQPEDFLPFILSPHVQGFYIAALGIAIAQAFQCYDKFIKHYINTQNAQELMWAPYGRIVVLHIAILLGGFAAQGLGQPVWALVVLIALKTLYDVAALKLREEDEHKLKVKDERPSENPAVPWVRNIVRKITEKRS